MTSTCIDWGDVKAAARALAVNHRDFQSFAWWDRPEDADDWAVVYTRHRDSRLLEQSNADAIAKVMKPFLDRGVNVRAEHHGHFGYGWADGYAIRVYRPGGKRVVTNAFREWCEIQARLAEYSVLDEADYSQRQLVAICENIRSSGSRFVTDDAPKDWPARVHEWLSENDEAAVRDRDDQGGYPSDEQLKAALLALELLDRDFVPPSAVRCKVCRLLIEVDDDHDDDSPPHCPYPNLEGFADRTGADHCLGSGLAGTPEYVEEAPCPAN